MRKRVTLIRGLEVEEVEACDPQHVKMIELHNTPPVMAADNTILDAASVDTHVLPIIDIFRNGRPDVYVAYSPEVERFLDVPINTAYRQLKEQQTELLNARREKSVYQSKFYQVKRMSFVDRLTFLLRGQKWLEANIS